jgi:hypothetical protein
MSWFDLMLNIICMQSLSNLFWGCRHTPNPPPKYQTLHQTKPRGECIGSVQHWDLINVYQSGYLLLQLPECMHMFSPYILLKWSYSSAFIYPESKKCHNHCQMSLFHVVIKLIGFHTSAITTIQWNIIFFHRTIAVEITTKVETIMNLRGSNPATVQDGENQRSFQQFYVIFSSRFHHVPLLFSTARSLRQFQCTNLVFALCGMFLQVKPSFGTS